MSEYINDIFNLKYANTRNMMIPIKLHKYTIEKFIIEYRGKCIILSSTHPETKEKVAIKCIPISFVSENGNEAKIMQDINHPNIIKYIESFKYPEKKPRFFAIVMPRAIDDLTHYILGRGPLEELLICKIMKQILNAVQYLHQNNIWHRDIKPDNILVMKETYDGIEVALADFGCADLITTETYNGIILGTLQYAAPELVERKEDHLSLKKTGKCMYLKKNQSNYLLHFYFKKFQKKKKKNQMIS